MLLELRKARKITRLRLVFRALFLTLATFPRVWIRPSKHGNHKVIVYYYFILSGVADGVSSWRYAGTDPSLFPNMLMANCMKHLEDCQGKINLEELLSSAYSEILQNNQVEAGTSRKYRLTELHSHEFCTTSDHFRVAHIQEHVLPLHDLTMFNSAVSNVQHQIT
jgi:hypothetical protein